MPRKPPIDRTAYGSLPVACHKEVVNLADRFVRIVEDVATDDLGRPIAGRHDTLSVSL
jgi:hypothetical protein